MFKRKLLPEPTAADMTIYEWLARNPEPKPWKITPSKYHFVPWYSGLKVVV